MTISLDTDITALDTDLPFDEEAIKSGDPEQMADYLRQLVKKTQETLEAIALLSITMSGEGTLATKDSVDLETEVTNTGLLASLDSINASHIDDSAITEAKLAALSVTLNKIRNQSITSVKLGTNAVTASKIAANAVTAVKIAANAVMAKQIAALSVGTDELIALSVTAGKIAASTITANKYAELRNTYVYNGDDSLDNSLSFIIPFKIVSEMTAINSAKLSFRILPYRAYSTAAASGGGSTPTSSNTDVGTKESTDSGDWPYNAATGDVDGMLPDSDSSDANIGTSKKTDSDKAYIGFSESTDSEDCGGGSHAHDLPSGESIFNGHTHDLTSGTSLFAGHVHEMAQHQHDLGALGAEHKHDVVIGGHTHTVTIAAHVHTITYAIHEESNSPTVHFHIDNVGDGSYGGASDNYTEHQLDIDISGSLSNVGWKNLRFDTDLRCRIFAIIELKLDITA